MNSTLKHPLWPRIALLLVIFIDSFSYFVVIPVLLQLFFNKDNGLLPINTSELTRNTLTLFTMALSTCAALIVAPVIGSLSDKYGRKKTLLLCLFAISIGFLLPIIGILKKSVFLILLGRFIGGIGTASQPVAQAVAADLYEGKERSLFFSLIALMMTLPIVLGPLAGGYLSDSNLVSWFNMTTPYWCAFGISLLSLFLIIFFFHETMASNIQFQILSIQEVIFGLRKVVQSYRIGMLLLIFFCLELSWSEYYQSIALYLNQQLHYSAQQVSLFYTYLGISMSLGLLILYPTAIKFLSVTTVMRYSIIFVFLGLLGCIVFHSEHMQLVFAPLIAVFTGTAYVSLLTLMSSQVSANHQGWMLGFISTVLFSAWIITALNGGWLITLNPNLPFYFAVIALLIVMPGLFRYESKGPFLKTIFRVEQDQN